MRGSVLGLQPVARAVEGTVHGRFTSAVSGGGFRFPEVIRSSSLQAVQQFENDPGAGATVSFISARASTGRFGRLYPATHATHHATS